MAAVTAGQRVENVKTGKTGTVTSPVTYRRNAGRRFPQVTVKWDDGGEWSILTRNLRPTPTA